MWVLWCVVCVVYLDSMPDAGFWDCGPIRKYAHVNIFTWVQESSPFCESLKSFECKRDYSCLE